MSTGILSVLLEEVMLRVEAKYITRKKDLMGTITRPLACTARKSPQTTAIHTTLYNLIAALSAEVGPDEEDVLTTVVHLLNTHRVTCTGDLRGYRLVCDVAQTGQKNDDLFSCFESARAPY